MTPDLERAIGAYLNASDCPEGFPPRGLMEKIGVCAVLRALLDTSPEVVEAIDAAYWAGPHGARKRGERAANAWRAGILAILGASK